MPLAASWPPIDSAEVVRLCGIARRNSLGNRVQSDPQVQFVVASWIEGNMSRWILTVLFVAGCGSWSVAQPADTNYDESKVPAYELPALLIDGEGE